MAIIGLDGRALLADTDVARNKAAALLRQYIKLYDLAEARLMG